MKNTREYLELLNESDHETLAKMARSLFPAPLNLDKARKASRETLINMLVEERNENRRAALADYLKARAERNTLKATDQLSLI